MASFTSKYVCKAGAFKSPSGDNYKVVNLAELFASCGTVTTTDGVFFITQNCNGAAGKISVKIKLEKGQVCRDS